MRGDGSTSLFWEVESSASTVPNTDSSVESFSGEAELSLALMTMLFELGVGFGVGVGVELGVVESEVDGARVGDGVALAEVQVVVTPELATHFA